MKLQLFVLALDAPGAYPLLLGRAWLCSANIKKNWQFNNISFRRGQAKVQVPTQETTSPIKVRMPLYAEDVNMLERLYETKLEVFLDKNPRIGPLFEVDVLETTNKYVTATAPDRGEYEPDPKSLLSLELSRARDAFDREMEIPASKGVTA